MGGSSSGDQKVRYAEYWEAAQNDLLNKSGSNVASKSVITAMNEALGQSPYGTATDIDVAGGFFSTGYGIASFPSLWDMFGKFMAGLDVHTLFDQTLVGVIASAPVDDMIAAHAAFLDNDIEANSLPRFRAGMRDINAVQSSAFVIGAAVIEDARIKSVNKFAAELRLHVVDIAADMWKSHLGWNNTVVETYSKMFQLFYATQLDVNNQDMEFAGRDKLWDIQLYEYVRAVLGTVSGSPGTAVPPGPSQTQKAISGTLGGAAVGYQVGGGYGALVGGILGFASSYL